VSSNCHSAYIFRGLWLPFIAKYPLVAEFKENKKLKANQSGTIQIEEFVEAQEFGTVGMQAATSKYLQKYPAFMTALAFHCDNYFVSVFPLRLTIAGNS